MVDDPPAVVAWVARRTQTLPVSPLPGSRGLGAVFVEATAQGLPVVRGEHASRGGGYHYYPRLDQVAAWVHDAGLQVIEDGHSKGDGYGYYHLLSRSRAL